MSRFLLVAIVLTAKVALAAPPEGEAGAYAEWFKGLQTPDTGIGCCDMADCRFAIWRYQAGSYEVWLGGKWRPVPDEKILDDATANPTRRAVVCWSPRLGIMCFVREEPA